MADDNRKTTFLGSLAAKFLFKQSDTFVKNLFIYLFHCFTDTQQNYKDGRYNNKTV